MNLTACVGDISSHGGIIITSGQISDKLLLKSLPVAAQGCLHACPVTGHGVTPVTSIVKAIFIGNKLMIGAGATAGCGAVILPSLRQMFIK